LESERGIAHFQHIDTSKSDQIGFNGKAYIWYGRMDISKVLRIAVFNRANEEHDYEAMAQALALAHRDIKTHKHRFS
jgi:hypothetical protein